MQLKRKECPGIRKRLFQELGKYRDCRARDQNSLKFPRGSALGFWGEDHNSLDFPLGSLWVFLDHESGWCKRE